MYPQVFGKYVLEQELARGGMARVVLATLRGAGGFEKKLVVKQIREMCVFSPHSVIKDPPFSRMDLVSCRNLLIYMNNDLQERLVQSFHYALRPGGFLLLGTSERLARNARLFDELDKKQRLYVRREDAHTRPHNFPSAQPRAAGNAVHAAHAPRQAGIPFQQCGRRLGRHLHGSGCGGALRREAHLLHPHTTPEHHQVRRRGRRLHQGPS